MKKIEQVLNEQPIINKAQLAESVNLTKQTLNNKLKGNNKNSLSIVERSAIKDKLVDILTEVIKAE